MIRHQFARRNLTPFVKTTLALQLEPLLAAKAKQNQGARTDLCQNSDKSIEPIDTKKEVAKVAGVSHDTVANTHKPMTTIRHLPKILMIFDPKTGKYTCLTLGKRGKEIDKTL